MARRPNPAALLARAATAEETAAALVLKATLAALDAAAGNQTRAAEALGVHVATVKRRLARAGLVGEALAKRWPLSARQPARTTKEAP